MKCPNEKMVKNGFRKGKQCFLCKVCGYQSTTDRKRANDFDRHIARKLRSHGMTVGNVAQLLGFKYTTVDEWAYRQKILLPVDPAKLKNYILNHENGNEIRAIWIRIHKPKPSKPPLDN